MAIEMLVAFTLAESSSVLKQYPLIVAFLPVVSAVAGNVGLQSSNINTRALACGLYTPDDLSEAVVHEMKCGAWCAVVMSLSLAGVSGLWFASTVQHDDNARKAMQGRCGRNRTVYFYHYFGHDRGSRTDAIQEVWARSSHPSRTDGDLDSRRRFKTSIQDILGYITFMLLGHL
eukprot:TRINITY_DN7617_c0_g1_i2.p1 TRINITY_DN7617_c0_g1~~TRINITY_DN7617_c0_g1_i2.p1  ORF type:complete len:174 (+),score=15.24 TRINITY_DN7617_c0_g1_i2:224-745(+)